MKVSIILKRILLIGLIVPVLACSTPFARVQVTPTPTKTPKPLPTLAEVVEPSPTPPLIPTATPVEVPPTETPLPPTETSVPADEPVPVNAEVEQLPTNTPEPPPPPTNTPPPPPPPPPTNTPIPPPPAPANTPVPPPPQNQGPIVIIELPNGDKYGTNDEVEIIITVRDSDGVKNFDWGVFAQNGTPLTKDSKDCGNSSECRTDKKFKTPLEGDFQIGVEAIDSTGQKTIQVSQIYVR